MEFFEPWTTLVRYAGLFFAFSFFEWLGYRNLFILAAIPSALSALIIYCTIREGKPRDTKLFHGLSCKDLSANFTLFLIVSSLFALGSFSYSFMLIYAAHFGFQITFIPVLYLIFAVTAAVCSLPSGKLSDKVGRKVLIVFSFICWGVVCLCLFFFTNRGVIIFAFVLYGLHKGILDTVQTTFVSELSPEYYKATGLGVFQMAVGICALPASLIAGLLWDQIHMYAPLYFSFALTLLATLMLLFVREKHVDISRY